MTDVHVNDRRAEMCLIGAAMMDAGVVDRVDLQPAAFLDPRLRAAWQAICNLTAEGAVVDAVTVNDRSGIPDDVLSKCVLETPTADNAEYYADIVRRHAVTRGVLMALADLQDKYRRSIETGRPLQGLELLSAALESLSGLEVGQRQDALHIGAVLKQRIHELDSVAAARAAGRVELTGLPTGVEALDAEIGGYQRGIVTIECGRPGMGKTALALAGADASSAAGYGVHEFSFEDSRAAFAERLMARASNIPTNKIRAIEFQRGQLATAMKQWAEIAKRTNWLYHDTGGLDAEGLVRAVRRHARANKTELVIVDYLQLLRRPRRYENKHDAIEQSMDVLAAAAKKDNMAYVVLCQLNRDVEKRPDKRPQLSDLRDSGSIEERSKCVLGLYRGSYYGDPKRGIDFDEHDRPPPTEEWERRAEIHVMKNNHGPTGIVRANFDGPTTRIW